jgi:hypothetical protein
MLSGALAVRALELGYGRLDAIVSDRTRRRVANGFYRKFLQRQVNGSYELMRILDRDPALWSEAVDEACQLAERYISAGLVD